MNRPDINIKSQSGMSLVETMIGVSIITIVMFFYANAFLEVKKSKKWSETVQLKNELTEDLISDLSLYTQCNSIIRAAIGSATMAPSFNGEISAAPFSKKFDHPSLEIERVLLNYSPVADDDSSSGSSYLKYGGQLTFEFRYKAGDVGKINVAPIVSPVMFYDEFGTGNWSDVTCTTMNNTILTSVGETCALYGGTLVDGTHCDFSRFFRNHYNGPESAVPILNVNDDVAKRHTMSDVLCYLDTLITLIPDQNVTATGQRDYDRDFYRRDYVTRFCKKPGIVKASTSVAMSAATASISEKVKPILLDVDTFPERSSCNFISFDYGTYSYTCVSSCSSPSPYMYEGKPYCYDSYYSSWEYYMSTLCYYGYGYC